MEDKKIFFIEDVKDIINLYSDPLRKAGYAIESYANGNEALAGINSVAEGKASVPKFIILDLMLPDISGLEILKVIRDKAVFNDTAVFIFTNYGDDKFKDAIKPFSKVTYLLKVDTPPFKLAELISNSAA